MFKRIALFSLAMATIAAPALARQAETPDKPARHAAAKNTLDVGDPAPALSIEKWVKGSEVKSFEKGKVYVVEFWATWCGPCMRSIPHLTELQKEYKDKGVTIIGVTTKDPNNSLAEVEKMVADKGDTMAYTVAFDKGQATSTAYMRAANQNGIPCAFVIGKDAKIATIMNPLDPHFNDVLAQVVAGTYDAAKAKADQEAMVAGAQFLMGGEYKNAIEGDDAAAAKKAYAKAAQLADGPFKDVPIALNLIAWTIVDPAGHVTTKDLDLALKAAQRGVDVTKSQDGAIIDTLARVYYCKGDLNKAIDLEKKAVAATPEAERGQLEATLKQYEQELQKKST